MGLQDVLAGREPQISYDEAKGVIGDYFMQLEGRTLRE